MFSKMSSLVIYSVWLLCLPLACFGQIHSSANFIVQSQDEDTLVQQFTLQAQTHYDHLCKSFFSVGFSQPQSIQLMTGVTTDATTTIDRPDNQWQLSIDTNSPCRWNDLYKLIASKLIQINNPSAPEWFKLSLANFLSHNVRMTESQIIFSAIPLKYDYSLANKITSDTVGNIKKLLSVSSKDRLPVDCEDFLACHIFHWLFSSNNLAAYLTNTRTTGYSIKILKDSSSTTLGQMKSELETAIAQKQQLSQAYNQAIIAETIDQQIQQLCHLVMVNQNCHYGVLQLAKRYNNSGQYQLCRSLLEKLSQDTDCVYASYAFALIGETYYNELQYQQALVNCQKAWKLSALDDNRFRLAYRIGHCYFYLGNKSFASYWYNQFLETEPDNFGGQMSDCIDFAKDFVSLHIPPAKIFDSSTNNRSRRSRRRR